MVGPFSSCFDESKTDRIKSGSYLIFLSVLVLGITTFVGLGGSFGACFNGGKGFVSVFVTCGVGASITGFFTGSVLAGAVLVATGLAGTGLAVAFFTGCGTAFLVTGTALGAGLAGTFLAGLAAFVWALTGFAVFAAGLAVTLTATFLAGAFPLTGAGFTFFLGAGAGFFAAAGLPLAFATGLAGAFLAGLAAFLGATFFVAIRLLPFFYNDDFQRVIVNLNLNAIFNG
ncbi:MAG TPA: hypothetical protein VER36_09630 [Flavisolibacter sp.]|nr:hypothetical protein [Flavisolibacter sp.]